MDKKGKIVNKHMTTSRMWHDICHEWNESTITWTQSYQVQHLQFGSYWRDVMNAQHLDYLKKLQHQLQNTFQHFSHMNVE